MSLLDSNGTLSRLKNTIVSTLSMVMLIGSLGYISAKATEMHNIYLRRSVSERIYIIKGQIDGGGGTGFAARGGKTGQSYIVTNAHVCEHTLKVSDDHTTVLVIGQDGSSMRRRVLEVSEFSDLCLIEGEPGVVGMSLGNEPGLGQTITVIGHPHLEPLTVSSGEVRGRADIPIVDHFMKTDDDEFANTILQANDEKCVGAKNHIVEIRRTFLFGKVHVKACISITKGAYMSTAIIWPGNSGSPVFNFWGNVIGVAFASDDTNWGYIVSIDDLRFLLAHY